MPTKQQLAHKETNRCKHTNGDGEQVCKLTGNYLKCHENGTSAESGDNKRCSAHKLVGQVNRGYQYRKFQKTNPGKGAQPKKKKILKRRRPSNSQKSSSSAPTSSSRSWSSNDSESHSVSLTKQQIKGKETKRCKHTNGDGEQVCKLTGNYIKCHENGRAAESGDNRRCSAHTLPGQVDQGYQHRKFKQESKGVRVVTRQRRVGPWETYNPISEVTVKTENAQPGYAPGYAPAIESDALKKAAKKNEKRVGSWETYNPDSEVRVKTEEKGEEY